MKANSINVQIEVDIVPSKQFDEVAKQLGYTKTKRCTPNTHENIVRCKDCKYAGTNDCVLDEHVPFKPEGFCSWGEER